MGVILQTHRGTTGGGGGGGGLELTGWENQVFVQATAFSSGITFSLAQTPLVPNALTVDYNGQRLNEDAFSLAGNVVTILFADPDVLSYDQPPTFQFNYPY